jgi:hypothetical protein
MHNNSVYKIIELLEGEVMTGLENCDDLHQNEIDRIKERVEDLIEDINVMIEECEDEDTNKESEESEDFED